MVANLATQCYLVQLDLQKSKCTTVFISIDFRQKNLNSFSIDKQWRILPFFGVRWLRKIFSEMIEVQKLTKGFDIFLKVSLYR